MTLFVATSLSSGQAFPSCVVASCLIVVNSPQAGNGSRPGSGGFDLVSARDSGERDVSRTFDGHGHPITCPLASLYRGLVVDGERRLSPISGVAGCICSVVRFALPEPGSPTCLQETCRDSIRTAETALGRHAVHFLPGLTTRNGGLSVLFDPCCSSGAWLHLSQGVFTAIHANRLLLERQP